MRFNEFHNGLRILLNIDSDEFMDAVYPNGTPHGLHMRGEWETFRENPYNWFIRASDQKAHGLWQLMQKRMTK